MRARLLSGAATPILGKVFGGDLPLNSVAPILSIDGDGTPAVGSLLVTTTGDWTKAPIIYKYAWYRGGTLIAGETSYLYTLKTADIGFQIWAEITATNANGSVIKKSNVTPTVYVSAPRFSDGLTTQNYSASLSNNNRTVTWASGGRAGSGVASTTSTKKWAVAARVDGKGGYWCFGLSNAPSQTTGINPGNNSNISIVNGAIYNNSSYVAATSNLNIGDIVTLTLDGPTKTVGIYVNGQNVYNAVYNGNLYPCWSDAAAGGAATLVLPYLPTGYEVWPTTGS